MEWLKRGQGRDLMVMEGPELMGGGPDNVGEGDLA